MKHDVFEKNSLFLLLGILIVVSIGGLVQIAPLFWIESTIEKVKGMRPYTPLEQVGRDIYIREGCYGCHSQMIRTLRDEVERYGHYQGGSMTSRSNRSPSMFTASAAAQRGCAAHAGRLAEPHRA
jgi:cbb3-type cytochrome c oxidase subunit II